MTSVSTSSTPPPKPRLCVKLTSNDILTWEELEKLELEVGSPQVKKLIKELVFPPHPPPSTTRTPAFELHLQRLRDKEANRKYAKMMMIQPNVPTSFSPEHTGVGASGFQHSVVGINMVIGVVCAFVGADYLSTYYGLEKTTKALVTLLSMIFMLIMEMSLFIIRASKFDVLDKQRNKDKVF